MKTLKLLFVFVLSATLLTSCVVDDVVIVDNSPQPISLNQLLNSYELWYVNVNATQGFGEVPFLQIAFTVSFRNGTMFANNNLVGIGSQGNGFGIPIGDYNTYDMVLDIDHDIDGFDSFDVFQIDDNTIELYNPFTDTSYFLDGYQRSNFDYDFVFYDNIHYFLQEYEVWEKTFTSNFGALNEFDNENYLQFLSTNNDSEFRSSQDINVANPNNIFWDFTGVYNVGNVAGTLYDKTLTLNYDFFSNEYFDLTVINDSTIELLHAASGAVYEFKGLGYIEFLRTSNAQGRMIEQTDRPKKRKQKTVKKDNPRENTRNI
ncbi:MAG: nicotinic acid mononucleotide adenyltransferase [Winogradskyella sp.]|uniref:nicotinic acid mononucleotide adenyltransferase n=1 Tax=Winogradskyella sp. TaxID=1883156 RepID=UPI0017A14841|nr:nicotinic acid mononucleotide adenyltransferase [Winogradskyella sp.]MBT8246095.1 nicotinic acid mononucleotide adenyltransferase [Winogradskyella sp.]NNK23001.1 nicotinic acid mononucleotide adenyltransferase [Winogradskyella sp.]